MERPPLKLFLPSDMLDDFCNALKDKDISFSLEEKRTPTLVVNQSNIQSLTEIVVDVLNTKAAWIGIGAVISNFIWRKSGRSIVIEKDGKRLEMKNHTAEEIAKNLEGAHRIVFGDDTKPPSGSKTPPENKK
ncbi:hypothetical protein [Candidatus Symbiopectobacterium sp. NZEC135]|uniref:hypothetical protein n=1 Tax=Candidatus Symbiopectobacterium sp. NZEC135 TaxID=2820471 RepID=UPI0022260487|nr:hypothetical protein [Candidatus Symbiopectobacterium sp. NZEC135]MCW2477764.1 hypothetical protein [Candidatus Symbiopectobacterium sp. NZEC135]